MENKADLHRKKRGSTKVYEAKLVERLAKEIKFEPRELKKLITIYKKYLKDTYNMDTSTFSEFLHNSFGFTEEFFISRIFLAADTNKDNRIDLEEFIKIVALMLRGSKEDIIKLCFTCYDLSENNELTRDDITALLAESLTESPYKEVNPDVVRDLAEPILTKLDQDHDGVISFEEFRKSSLEDWLILEAFGQCLPDYRHRAAFLILLETDEEIDADDVDIGEED